MKKLIFSIALLGMSILACGASSSSRGASNSDSSNSTVSESNNRIVKEVRKNEFDFEKRTVKLNSGYEMPIIGLGVWTLTQQEAEASVLTALQNGYRLIDTAHAYNNEEGVGRAIKKSGIPREEIFVTTKLASWLGDYENPEKAINDRLRRLGLDYIDLLLLHSPASNDKEAYKAMEKAVKEGKVKSIGLSNYYEEEFNEILKIAEILPAVVQNETHVYQQSIEVKKLFDKYGTVQESWYPLGGRNSYGRGGKDTLFNDPTIVKIAKNHNKTSAQILLRWQIQDGNIAIPGSRNPDHIKENISIFDFELTPEEMQEIRKLDKKTKFSTF